MTNKSKIIEKLRIIKENIAKLETLRRFTEEEFTGNFQRFDSAKYNLQTAIEAMIDICNHIISSNTYEIPNTNADSIRILCSHNIISPEMQDKFVAMTKFRDRVVHIYHQVDNAEVYRILAEELKDFQIFINDITIFMEK